MTLEKFKTLDTDNKLWELYKLMCKMSGNSLCSPARSDLSNTYINNIIKNSRDMTSEEEKLWSEMDEEISEVVEI